MMKWFKDKSRLSLALMIFSIPLLFDGVKKVYFSRYDRINVKVGRIIQTTPQFDIVSVKAEVQTDKGLIEVSNEFSSPGYFDFYKVNDKVDICIFEDDIEESFLINKFEVEYNLMLVILFFCFSCWWLSLMLKTYSWRSFFRDRYKKEPNTM